MPHYVPAGGVQAHGLILANLKPTAAPAVAMAAIAALPLPPTLTLRTISHFEAEHPPNTPVAPGDVITVFINTNVAIRSAVAHDALHAYAAAVWGTGFFAGQPKHW